MIPFPDPSDQYWRYGPSKQHARSCTKKSWKEHVERSFYLNIFGFFLKSIIVDSRPIDDFPPSNINFIFFPKSSFTSEEQTALTFDDMLALGAANGNLSLFNKFFIIKILSWTIVDNNQIKSLSKFFFKYNVNFGQKLS